MLVMRVLAALILALVASACATNPVTGRQESRHVAGAGGDAGQAGRRAGRARDRARPRPEPVRRTSTRSASASRAHSPRRDVAYRFFIADMPEPNAFALPGGYIYVSRGLLALANSEDELAGVIGHEIGHVAARHSAQRQTRQAGVGILAALGTHRRRRGRRIRSRADGFADGSGRRRRTDRVVQPRPGAPGGPDRPGPRSRRGLGSRRTRRLPDHARARGNAGRPERSGARRSSIRTRSPASAPSPRAVARRSCPRGSRSAHRREPRRVPQALEGVVVGTNPDEGVFRENVFLHPGLGFALTFPPRWQTKNSQARRWRRRHRAATRS